MFGDGNDFYRKQWKGTASQRKPHCEVDGRWTNYFTQSKEIWIPVRYESCVQFNTIDVYSKVIPKDVNGVYIRSMSIGLQLRKGPAITAGVH